MTITHDMLFGAGYGVLIFDLAVACIGFINALINGVDSPSNERLSIVVIYGFIISIPLCMVFFVCSVLIK